MMRLGILPKNIEFNRPIWIHAVSVGEVMAAKYLIEELRMVYPAQRLFISTVTPTGNKIAQSIAKGTDFVAYLPLDLSFIVKSVVDKINPLLFVAMETEIWPNLMSYLYKKNIPIIIANGRVSDHSFKGYLSIKFLLKPVLNKINLFCVQTHQDAERLMRLGVLGDRIQTTGNMKFDLQDYTDSPANLSDSRRDPALREKVNYTDFRLKLGLSFDEKLMVAGSTHRGEEEIILSVYKELLTDFPNLKLLIAPRHPERTGDIEKIVVKNGFNSVKVSELNRQMPPLAAPRHSAVAGRPADWQTVFILDTVGRLLDFYIIADIVFVGGSLVKKGGHNILEPAALGKPVIFGPHMFNFRDIAGLFLDKKAGILVYNKEELKIKIKELLNNPIRVNELSQRAQALILQNKGATRRNLEYIKRLLS